MKLIDKLFFVLGDCLLIDLAVYAALLLRFESHIPGYYTKILLYTFALAPLTSVIVFYLFGLYSRLWVYASIEELIQIFSATVVGSIVQYVAAFVLNIAMPRSVYIIAWLIIFFLVGGFRLSHRIKKKIESFINLKAHKLRVMIVGAGRAGSIAIKDIKTTSHNIYMPVVVIDDDTLKHKTKINGIPVVGGRDKIIETAKEMNIDEIMISIPSIPRKEILSIINICKQTQCKVKVLPGVYSIVNGDVSIKEIKDVNIEDLLGRSEFIHDNKEIAHYLKNETVLVTGGGGSIGSELCRQIIKYKPKQLLIFDIYENTAFSLQNELLHSYKGKVNIKVIIGSIRDKDRLNEIFSTYKPTVIFHAAAHKHVPLMEENPQEAIKNNVYGTLNVAQCAHKYKSKRFILVSTDKAVNPTNIMGSTKRIAEMVIQHMNQCSTTKYAAVRFGNVLGSHGSVIPIFKRQILQGGPLTITHPEITRYFMTIPEAASLVIQAGSITVGGEIFVLDMGEPVKIVDLANMLITLSGLEPGVDIDIKYTGLRPGEKLYEELLISDGVSVTKNDKIFIEKSDKTDFSTIMKEIQLYKDREFKDIDEIKSFIKRMVPTYHSNEEVDIDEEEGI